jgi:hypothetical protein
MLYMIFSQFLRDRLQQVTIADEAENIQRELTELGPLAAHMLLHQ